MGEVTQNDVEVSPTQSRISPSTQRILETIVVYHQVHNAYWKPESYIPKYARYTKFKDTSGFEYVVASSNVDTNMSGLSF